MTSYADFVAIAIALGYSFGAFSLWRNRSDFGEMGVLGWLVLPIALLFALFYFSVPFIDGVQFNTYFVWASRLGHAMIIALIFVALAWGKSVGREP